MNFTLLPSSSVLIHSSSRMFVACTYKVRNDTCGLFSLWPHGSWALDTNVDSKLFVTLGCELLLHSIQGFVKERTGRLKHPVALGPTETLKARFLDPYQLAWHGWSIGPPLCKREKYLPG